MSAKTDIKCVFNSHRYHFTVVVTCLYFHFLHHFAFKAYLHLNGCELLHYQRLMTFMCIAYFMEHLFPFLQLCDACSLFIPSTPLWHFVDQKEILTADSQKPNIHYIRRENLKCEMCLSKVNVYPMFSNHAVMK